MILLKFLIIFAILIASLYLVSVSVCIVGRMTCKTSHITRFAVISVAGVAFAALIKTITDQWAFCAVDLSHIVTVFMCAITMLFNPRIPT